MYEELKGGYPEMFEAMMEFMKPEIDAKIDETKLENIKSVMKKLEYTPQQAMDLLDIPVNDQPKYQAKL